MPDDPSRPCAICSNRLRVEPAQPLLPNSLRAFERARTGAAEPRAYHSPRHENTPSASPQPTLPTDFPPRYGSLRSEPATPDDEPRSRQTKNGRATCPGIKAFRKGVDEFHTYVTCNAHTIANYAERHRYGERVSTAFVESTVNTVVGKRFSKRQQMSWSKPGAHLMLQTRTRVLDDTHRAKFQSWYPGLFNVYNADHTDHDLAA